MYRLENVAPHHRVSGRYAGTQLCQIRTLRLLTEARSARRRPTQTGLLIPGRGMVGCRSAGTRASLRPRYITCEPILQATKGRHLTAVAHVQAPLSPNWIPVNSPLAEMGRCTTTCSAPFLCHLKNPNRHMSENPPEYLVPQRRASPGFPRCKSSSQRSRTCQL